MRTLKALAVAACAAFAITSAARATDLVDVVPPAPPYVPVEDGFDWNGIYFGKFVFQNFSTFGTGYNGIGKALGFNLELGQYFLVGGEVRAQANLQDFSFDSYSLVAVGRAGFILVDNFLIYAVGGASFTDFGGGSNVVESVFGGGVEVGLSDNLSLRGEITHRECIGGNVACLVGGYNQAHVGLLWHFN